MAIATAEKDEEMPVRSTEKEDLLVVGMEIKAERTENSDNCSEREKSFVLVRSNT